MGHDPSALSAYYANLIVGKRTGIPDTQLIAAFEAVPRERFVGPGPWKVFVLAGKYIENALKRSVLSLSGRACRTFRGPQDQQR